MVLWWFFNIPTARKIDVCTRKWLIVFKPLFPPEISFFSRPFQSSIDYSHCDIWKPWRKWVNFLILLNPRLYRISPFFALRVWMVTWPWPQSFFFLPFVGSARTRVQKRRTFIDKPNDNTIKRLLVFVPIELGTRNQKKSNSRSATTSRIQLLQLYAGSVRELKARSGVHNTELK